MITVSIVEDDPVTRQALARLISKAPGFQCLGAHASVEAAILRMPDERPGVALIDLVLPNSSGAECVRRLKPVLPETKFVVVSHFEDTTCILRALRAGACGYVLKKTRPAKLLEAIREAHAGGTTMSSEVAACVVAYFHEQGKVSETVAALTRREVGVLDHLASGSSDKEIADQLGIGLHTVNGHLKRIYQKLRVHTRTAAVSEYWKRKLRMH